MGKRRTELVLGSRRLGEVEGTTFLDDGELEAVYSRIEHDFVASPPVSHARGESPMAVVRNLLSS